MSSRYRLQLAGAVAVSVAVAACGKGEAPPPAATPAPAPVAPAPPPKVRVYVTNEWSGDLTVINADTQDAIGTYKLGKRPRGAAVESSDETYSAGVVTECVRHARRL